MFYTNHLLETLINCYCILFGASEIILFVLKRSKKSEVKIRKDKFSMLILWVVILASVFFGGYIARLFPIETPFLIQCTGMAIMTIGLFIRWLAIFQLGKAFTVDVSISNTHKINDRGMYSVIRHPSYLGLLIAFTGLSLLFGSYYAIPVIMIPILIALAYRIYVEEQLLLEAFGEDYEMYMMRTNRIIPFIY